VVYILNEENMTNLPSSPVVQHAVSKASAAAVRAIERMVAKATDRDERNELVRVLARLDQRTSFFKDLWGL